ncbi:hypothetical protein BU17DRAFT_79034 [Hysterangium stoloniferum]|nr:hypothetical protein BU17DRAFT_79034 [Hysterangium stoloniferum]
MEMKCHQPSAHIIPYPVSPTPVPAPKSSPYPVLTSDAQDSGLNLLAGYRTLAAISPLTPPVALPSTLFTSSILDATPRIPRTHQTHHVQFPPRKSPRRIFDDETGRCSRVLRIYILIALR